MNQQALDVFGKLRYDLSRWLLFFSCLIASLNRQLGVVTSREWVDQCIQFLTTNGVVNTSTPLMNTVDLVMRAYLDFDIYITYEEENMLPDNLDVRQFTYFEIIVDPNLPSRFLSPTKAIKHGLSLFKFVKSTSGTTVTESWLG